MGKGESHMPKKVIKILKISLAVVIIAIAVFYLVLMLTR